MPTQEQIDRATARRVQIVEEIRESLRSRKYPPTVSELALATGVSKPQIRTDLGILVDAGILERDPGVPRGLRITTGRRK